MPSECDLKGSWDFDFAYFDHDNFAIYHIMNLWNIVRPTMAYVLATGGKALAALVAAKGFLARVRPAMDGETAAAGEALAALVAVEGFLARVRAAMDGETAAG